MSASREILLVGGSGFMGTHVARGLLARGYRVTVLARGRREAAEGVTVVTIDRRDATSLVAALQGRRFDLTVDFLAYDALDLEWLARMPAASLGRYVMISSGQVYLVGEQGEPPFVEEDARHPIRAEPATGDYDRGSWSYGVGKRRAEQALIRLGETHGLRATALRLPIVQGEGDGSRRLWAYLERMLDGGPIVLPDGGDRPVRYLYAGDLALVLVRLVDGPPPRHFAYNLAQPDIMSLRDFLGRVAQEGGKATRFVEASWGQCRDAGLDEGFSPYAGRWSSVLDPTRATVELGFTGMPVPGYLPRVVRWHLEHRPPSHDGYAQRAHEVELAASLAGAGRPS